MIVSDILDGERRNLEVDTYLDKQKVYNSNPGDEIVENPIFQLD
jgi:hypothetical protein